MITKKVLTAHDARAIAAAAEAEAKENGWAVTIAIVDDGGHLLWLQRLDGAPPISATLAAEKARTAGPARIEALRGNDQPGPQRVSVGAPCRHARRRRPDPC